jgi:hypothetical protein
MGDAPSMRKTEGWTSGWSMTERFPDWPLDLRLAVWPEVGL